MFKHFREVVHPRLLGDTFFPQRQRWYCGHCIDGNAEGLGWLTAQSVIFHVQREHYVDAGEEVEGENYLVGSDLWVKLGRWRQECDNALSHFVNVLDSIEGVDDFLIDFPETEAA